MADFIGNNAALAERVDERYSVAAIVVADEITVRGKQPA